MANDTIVLRTIYIQVFVKLFEELAHQSFLDSGVGKLIFINLL